MPLLGSPVVTDRGSKGSTAVDVSSPDRVEEESSSFSVAQAFSETVQKQEPLDESILTGDAETLAATKLREVLAWAHKLNPEIPTVSTCTKGKRSFDQMSDTPKNGDKKWVGEIYQVLSSSTMMDATQIRNICEACSIDYPQSKNYKSTQPPKNMAMMSIAIMADHYFSTDELKVPNLD